MTALPTLADEILSALPKLLEGQPKGADVRYTARWVSASQAHVRTAFLALHASRRAVVVRRRKGFYLLPAGHPGCLTCHREFKRPKKSKRVTCSRSCAVALSWTDPETAASRVASIRKERATPRAKERAAKFNENRWSRPGERERLSEWNKKRWADPATRATLSAAIQAAQGTPEMRKLYAGMRKAEWQDPDNRERRIAALKRTKSKPESRAKHSERMRRRWRDPVEREKLLGATKRNSRKGAAAVRGKKQTPEQIEKRVASRRATIASRNHEPTGVTP